MADIITKSGIVSDVPKAWAKSYENYRGPNALDMKRITSELRDLPSGFSADDVEKIIGNKSWTTLHCDQCGNDVDAVARFGAENPVTLTYDICEVCIRQAGIAVRSAKEGRS